MIPAVGLIVTMTALEGRGDSLAQFLRDAVPDAEAEVGTLTWAVLRSSETTFHIVDTFPDDDARRAHIEGVIAQAMQAQGPDLFAGYPDVVRTEVVAMMPSKGIWTIPDSTRQ